MDKRYQVFVSSTYADLKEERRKVLQALMEMDCIPSGMELFPAADEEQWVFIKKIIDDCDYYLLIIGGRYGSTATDGVSYTEKEYDYAIEKGIKVIALLHEDPEQIPVAKSDVDPVLRERLRKFRDKVKSNRLVRFWKEAADLPGLVALSLSKTIKMYPATGWIRADRVPSEALLSELNEVRKENERLKHQLAEYVRREKPQLENLAKLNDTVTVTLKWTTPRTGAYSSGSDQHTKEVTVSWKDIFSLLAPHLLTTPPSLGVNRILGKALYEKAMSTNKSRSVYVKDQDFQTIKIQLIALNLVELHGGGSNWSLTPHGNNLMMQLRTVKSH